MVFTEVERETRSRPVFEASFSLGLKSLIQDWSVQRNRSTLRARLFNYSRLVYAKIATTNTIGKQSNKNKHF
jgi:hypothetical protein